MRGINATDFGRASYLALAEDPEFERRAGRARERQDEADRRYLARRHGYVSEPTVLLTGCQAWPPRKDPSRPCPVCDTGINPADADVSCLWCDSEHWRRARDIAVARRNVDARDRSEVAGRKLRDDIRRRARRDDEDSRERFVRRLWNGYGGSLYYENPDVMNLLREARKWLAELGLVPDFSRRLDRRDDDAMDHVEQCGDDVDADAVHRHVEMRPPLEATA